VPEKKASAISVRINLELMPAILDYADEKRRVEHRPQRVSNQEAVEDLIRTGLAAKKL